MTPLRQRMTEDMRIRNLAITTQRPYLFYVSQFGVDPTLLSPGAIFNPLAHHS
jgi:hypothetical protein